MNRGIKHAALAYVCWGLFPLYFHLLGSVPALQVLAHRIVWSMLFVMLLLTVRRQWAWLRPVLQHPRTLLAFGASALLLSTNWLTYIWAVGNGHVIDASLGYFITPLVNVVLGYTVLGERPRPLQWAALLLAGAGVLWLALQTGHLPWIAIVLAATFGTYGLLRKIAPLGALEGLTLETLLLTPLALALLIWWGSHGESAFPAPTLAMNVWLIGVGPVTAIPLLLFAAGARMIPMTTLGILQYIGPTIQFLIGIWVFDEAFGSNRLAGFSMIWLALLIYSGDSWMASRRSRAASAAI